MPVKAILFDFDGVILDSLDVKTQAFYDMYLPYGEEIARKAADYHLAHGGVSRFEKFRYYHREFLGREIDEAEVDRLADQFSELVFQRVVNAKEVAGIRQFLDDHHADYRCWIITGTPTAEILQIARATGFDRYFVDIYGSPEKKDYWTGKILQEEGLHPDEVVFVGDATTDYDAAMKHRLRFILREHGDNLRFFEGMELIRIRDFIGFDNLLRQL